jgi:hypothetical protein
MSKVWDAIKSVERERELAGRQRSPAERETTNRPITAYLAGVRRRCQERCVPSGLPSATAPVGKRPR